MDGADFSHYPVGADRPHFYGNDVPDNRYLNPDRRVRPSVTELYATVQPARAVGAVSVFVALATAGHQIFSPIVDLRGQACVHFEVNQRHHRRRVITARCMTGSVKLKGIKF